MTPQELKNSILQLAVQGKLVEQRPEEGTGEELYQQIQAEKKRLIKAGKIKKEKLLPEIAEDEKPFDIPESWMWVRVRDCCIDVFNGKSPVYEKNETQYRIVGQAANQQNGLDFSQVKYTNEAFWTKMDSRYFLQENDVLLNTLGNGTLGRSGIVTKLSFPLLTDGHLFVFRLNDEVQSKYFYYYLQLRRTDIEKNANGSTNQTFLSLGKTMSWIVPLPPLAEQKRIVAKIEELLPYIDRYEAAWSRLEDFNNRFPVDMQKSILQMAIQGKLVEQRHEEGTGEELYQQIQAEKQKLIKAGKIKKEKPLPKIADDETPFDIPENWKWARLGDLVTIRGGKRIPAGRSLTTTPTEHIYIRVTDMQDGTILDNDLHYVPDDIYPQISKYIITEDDIYIVIVGSTIGKTGLVPSKFSGMNLTENAARLTPYGVDRNYLYTIMSSSFAQRQFYDRTKQVGQPKLAINRMQTAIIPIPPLAEQKRIVAKLEELLPLCERLK